jgi:hypothetical protein
VDITTSTAPAFTGRTRQEKPMFTSLFHRNGNPHGHNGNGDGSGDRELVIRRLASGDEDALRVLAERDTTRPPDGEVVAAEKDGRLLAAISLDSGEVVADPFHPTADVVALLRVRAGQLVPPIA